ncbi:hypothetical protein IE81DRAFT_319252 [Ceraceosorus guamensis]|uniref:Uncharacterized protein n=1 Tax=Ceraceosorus guamensis TaxID=1522189 RepID=A0A316W8U8_9BASI|nr:hypothetical protein IE81DRAFT_319252 [Ceraceosorus guamensis]PWN46346.1 hypothetical protein IE81DRAFT_319252 [Ceraceosorus guamensis]
MPGCLQVLYRYAAPCCVLRMLTSYRAQSEAPRPAVVSGCASDGDGTQQTRERGPERIPPTISTGSLRPASLKSDRPCLIPSPGRVCWHRTLETLANSAEVSDDEPCLPVAPRMHQRRSFEHCSIWPSIELARTWRGGSDRVPFALCGSQAHSQSTDRQCRVSHGTSRANARMLVA